MKKTIRVDSLKHRDKRRNIPKTGKIATARNLWVPAVNNHGGFGRWAFIEIADPWDCKNVVREAR